MALLEKCLLHEVSGTSDSLLSEEHHERSFSLRPGKRNLWLRLHCECDCACLCACRGATPSKRPKLKFALSVWRSPIENNPCNLMRSAERRTICRASVPIWMSLWLRCFGCWTYDCAHYRKIISREVRAGAEWWRVWAMLIFGGRTGSDSRFQTPGMECARQFLISLQSIVVLSLILQCN